MTTLLLFLALGRPAAATEVEVGEQACPLGGGFVKIYTRLSANTHGGFDSDLATYSTEGQFREYAVSTCADNLFSLYGTDMADPVIVHELQDPALAGRLTAALRDELRTLPAKGDPEVWERYGIAARMYKELGRDELFLAQLYLEASWTARDRAVGVYLDLQGPPAVRSTLAQGEAELAKNLPVAQRKTLLYNLARVAHRGGFPLDRDRYIAAFVAAGPMTAKEQAAIDALRHFGGEVEPHYQDLAIEHFVAGLRQEGLDMDAKIRATYTLADLMRRRGRTQEALGLYALVMSEEQAPQELREMALMLSRKLVGDE